MKLLPNEETLITSNEDKIVLTNNRIQMNDSVWGQSYKISIFLEDISSIEIKYKSNVLFLFLGVICILGGLYMGGQSGSEEMIGGLVLGAVLIAIWWFSRKNIISISSNGGSSLNFLIQGMDEDTINDFIHNVSLAKQKRVNQLAKL